MSYMWQPRLKSLKHALGAYKRTVTYNFSKFKVLSRCACMGHDVLSELGWEQAALNHQKSRVDHLLKLSETPWIKPKPHLVKPHLNRKDIFPLICQERQDFWGYKRPDVIFMDSYSELTDQLFVCREEGWQFLANYTDIDHNDSFNHVFECCGLLGLDELEKLYFSFFSKLRRVYGNIPFIFLHFPTVLDNRNKFKKRGIKIAEIVDNVACRFENLYSIQVPDKIVGKVKTNPEQELREFPYHFNKNVCNYLADNVLSLSIRSNRK